MKKYIALLSLVLVAVAYGATTFTTNYSFNKPGDEDRNYGELIRDNWDKADSQIKINETSISDHLADTVDAHDASAISTVPGASLCTIADDVQEFLDCLDGVLDPSVSGLVLIAGSQTITGLKTFAVTPIFPASPSGILNTDAGGIISASSFSTLDPLTTKGDLLVQDASTSVRLPVGTDGQILVADSSDAEGIVWENPNPRWRKFTLTFSDFSAGATSFGVAIFSLQAGEGLDSVVLHHTTAFSGGSITAYTVEVGQPGDPDEYADEFDVFQASGNTVSSVINVLDVPNFGATTSVVVTARSVGDNLDQASAGSVDVYVRTFLLP